MPQQHAAAHAWTWPEAAADAAEYERVQQRNDSTTLPDTEAEPMEEDTAADVPTKVVSQVRCGGGSLGRACEQTPVIIALCSSLDRLCADSAVSWAGLRGNVPKPLEPEHHAASQTIRLRAAVHTPHGHTAQQASVRSALCKLRVTCCLQ